MAELFILVLLLERASLVPIDLDINLLYDLLEYLIVEVGKELVELKERDAIVFLQEPNHIGLGASLDEVVVLATLGVIDLHCVLGLYLTHEVHV